VVAGAYAVRGTRSTLPRAVLAGSLRKQEGLAVLCLMRWVGGSSCCSTRRARAIFSACCWCAPAAAKSLRWHVMY
jgi:hypothetical protein